jgi:hypothetical protein
MSTITLSPRNSIVFVYDSSHRSVEVPTYVAGDLVAASQTCVSIGTLAEIDGETTITLADSIDGISVGELFFDGVLLTPGHEVSVCTSENEKLLTLPIKASHARVRVFANDPSEPDEIVVVADTNAAS